MNVRPSNLDAEDRVSLEKTLYDIRDDLAAARVAAMQILVFHMQSDGQEAQGVDPEEFINARADIQHAHDSLRVINEKYLKSHQIKLTDELNALVKKVSGDLDELVRILDRCTQTSENGIRGFQPAQNMYDLCCTRVAKGLSALSAGLAEFFLHLTEKEKAEALEKTSNIAQEIGKIGRVINMVATNASIEAARVGDAGKGFTVIADEVKSLSARVSSLSVSLTDRLS
ncbi:methyl-accepting chemotaxis protein [Roseobacter weihaiensis]|uniref:methyl-accepting chemotaxis protein n=1 Tax=Roseobacter weihaiensis TaxID=2763262 RepID=UPI0029CAC4B9|nr:methyl-accepting chemotaxis protein [Roseobacter sp. H9]